MKLLRCFSLSLVALTLLAAPQKKGNATNPINSANQATTNPKPPKQGAKAKVNVNTATIADLTQLGISNDEAARIVQSRPYKAKKDLTQKQVISMDTFNKIKDRIIAR